MLLATAVCGSVGQAATPTYLPLKETQYNYDAAKDAWVEFYRAEYTVDDVCRRYATTHIIPAATPDWPEELVKFTFDDKNRNKEKLTMRRDAATNSWLNYDKREYAYDDVVPGYTILNRGYYWNETSWFESWGQVWVITRNDKGVVVSNVEFSGDATQRDEPVAKTVCATSSDGTVVTAVKYYSRAAYIPGSTLEPVCELRDIVWHTTDGQYLDLTPSAIGDKNNRMSYAKVYSDGEEAGELTASYTDGGYSFKLSNDVKQEYTEYEYTVTDPLTGSYRMVNTEKKLEYTDDVSDINGDGIINENDKILRSTVVEMEYAYNEEGRIILQHTKWYRDDVMTGESHYVYEYEYDADGHVTMQKAYYRQLGDSELMLLFRKCYSDFYDISTAVGEVVAEAKASVSVAGRTLTVSGTAASTLAVFALDGKSVATAAGEGSYSVALDGLASGIYIATVSTGADTVTAKIVLR